MVDINNIKQELGKIAEKEDVCIDFAINRCVENI